MSFSFFYSQDSDCPICSPKVHPVYLNSSFLVSSESLSPMAQKEHAPRHTVAPTQNTAKSPSIRPTTRSRHTDDESESSNSGCLRASSAISFTTSSSSSPSSRNPVKRVLANISARRASRERHSPRSRSNKARNISSLRMGVDPMQPTTVAKAGSGWCDDIHPYNFFEASLHMGEDFTLLEDGWMRWRTAGR
jgi:hypothetical protein